MNDYSITDYGIFSNGVSTTKNYNTKIDEVGQGIETCKTTLSDSGVLMGPFQEECLNEINKLNTDFSSVKTNFSSLANLLVETSGNYQSGDEKASNTILEKTATDSTTSLSTSSTITNTKMSIPSDPTIASKKQEWLGDVDDASRYTEYTGNNLFGRHNTLELFDNTTGEVIQDHGTITMKPGETRIITVKLPTDTGMIDKITRTTADGDSAYRSGKVVSGRSDIDPDPNNIEYVRMVEGANGSYHEPSDLSLLHNNSYDWVLTANAEGKVTASQTCLWSSSMTKGRNLKGMINLNVEVSE